MKTEVGNDIEERILTAAEDPKSAGVETLADDLLNSGLNAKSVAEHVQFLFESWGSRLADTPDLAPICVDFAERLPFPDSPASRTALGDAFRHLLPAHLRKAGSMSGLGLNEPSLSISVILERFRKLRSLDADALVYRPQSRSWVSVSSYDPIASVLVAQPLTGGKTIEIPLESALAEHLFFRDSPVLRSIAEPVRGSIPNRTTAAQTVSASCASQLSEEKTREILLFAFVPKVFQPTVFEKWWANSGADIANDAQSGAGTGRKLSDARSLRELHLILVDSLPDDDGETVSDSERYAGLGDFFAKLKEELSDSEEKILLECLAMIADRGEPETVRGLLAALRPKIRAWSDSPKIESLPSLQAWPEIAPRLLPGLVRCTAIRMGTEQAARLGLHLPQRCLSAFFSEFPEEMAKALRDITFPMGDPLLYLWRNRSRLPEDLVRKLTFSAVSKALFANVPTAWTAAQKELRKLLIDHKDFHGVLLKNAGGDEFGLVREIQLAPFLDMSEQQSLLVKLSRVSKNFRDALENGAAGNAFVRVADKARESQQESLLLTSHASYMKKLRKLEHLIQRLIPENTAAIAHARSYGDLRENAEYKAAKEEEGRLLRMRAEMEMEIGAAQPCDLATIASGTVSALGTTVKIQAGEQAIEYHIVGAWDGDPDRHLISYKTPLGQALLHRSDGDEITLPGGQTAIVLTVSRIPDTLLAEIENTNDGAETASGSPA